MASNYKLSPCQILIDGQDMGKTNGGVTVALAETSVQLKTDQDGDTPVDEIVSGATITVTGSLAENTLTNIATLAKSSVQTSGSKKRVDIYTNVGYSLLTNAKSVVLKPYDGTTVSTDANEYITIAKAGISLKGNLQYDAKNQRVIAFSLTGYPDSTGLLASFSDTTV